MIMSNKKSKNFMKPNEKTMKSNLNFLGTFALMAMAFSFVLVSCQKDSMELSTVEGSGEIATLSEAFPVDISDDVTTIPDNATVLDHGMIQLDANTTEIEGCDYVYKLDYPVPPDASATIDAPEGFDGEIKFTVTGNKVDGYTIEVEDNIAGFTAVINAAYFGVGNNARKFTFDPSITYAGPLPAPLNPSGNDADISHTHFCYSIIEDENGECEWVEETAFGGDTEGGGSAWWFAFDTKGPSTQGIYAGQKLVEGASVEYDAESDKLNIVLGDKLKLQDVTEETNVHPRTGAINVSINDEQVKVQGFDELPLERPAAGLYELYKGRDLEIQGDGSRYYVIHLDVEVLVCEEEED
jgi:hypothetical protein